MQNIKHHAANNKTKKQEDSLTINQDRLAISKNLFMQQSLFQLQNRLRFFILLLRSKWQSLKI